VTESLTRRFGDVTAVDRLDLTVPRGVIFGFLGPNGAGKSTTINMLTSLLPPAAGTARVGGLDTRALKEVLRDMVDRRGTTIFFSTHVMDLAERFCDQVGIINRGQLVQLGSIPQLRQRAGLADDVLHSVGLYALTLRPLARLLERREYRLLEAVVAEE